VRTVALYALYLASGALGLAYELLWMRQLTPLFGATTLATTAALSAFQLGNLGFDIPPLALQTLQC